jgi:transcription antitermination factor NusG
MVGVTSEYLSRMFEPGTPVIVDEGPFEGLPATVLAVGEHDRLIVTVALLSGLMPLTLDPTAVHIDHRPTTIRLDPVRWC